MDLKKSLKYIAFGFLFTLLNINLTAGTLKINVMPDFIGWILFFIAFDGLGDYGKGKEYLKWIALGLLIATAVLWVFSIARPSLDLNIVDTVVTVVSAVFMFVLFGILEKIAGDIGSKRASILRMLKYFNLVLYVLFIVTASLAGYVSLENYAIPAALTGVAALVCAIVSAFVLFGLSKEVSENQEAEA